MSYFLRSSACFFVCYLPALPLLADMTIEASGKLLNFNYEEFDLSDQSINKETGIIPGLSISASETLNSITGSLGYEVYNGQVNYDGQTQSGTPHVTNTNETLYRVFYKLSWSPEHTDNSIYGKISWQQWDRYILPANNISGLFEQYQWRVLEIGFLTTLYKVDSNKWLFELGASKISNGTIKIDLSSQGFGIPELNLGNGSGISTALIYQYKITEQSKIGLSLQYQHWTFGRSNTETISNGASTIDITEPRSVTNHGTISLNYKYHF